MAGTASCVCGLPIVQMALINAMEEAIHPVKPTSSRGLAWVLVCGSFASFILFLVVLVPPFVRAGRMMVSPIEFILGIAFAAVCIVSFIRCPRRFFIAKSLAFLFLLPVLPIAVEMVVKVVGRCIDPSVR